MHELGMTYKGAHQLPKALPLLEEAVAKRKVKLGPDNPLTLLTMSSLAIAYFDDDQRAKGLALMEETVKRQKATLPSDHPDLLDCLHTLGEFYEDIGQPAKAVPVLVEAYEKRKAKLGADNVDILDTLHLLGPLLFRAGRHADAEPCLAEWLRYQRDKLRDHADVAWHLSLLGECRVVLKKFAEAEAPLRDSLDIYKRTQPNSDLRFNSESLLGAALAGQKKFAEAEPLLLHSAQAFVDAYPKLPANSQLLAVAALERIINWYEAWGKKDEAKKWREKKKSVVGN
jgi:tetratricopeptide (TPR) repeat protein